jgi:acyl dehydratase
MPIDPEKALAAEPTVREVTWTTRDVLLYHLSLGAGVRADVYPELPWSYERDLRVLPTFATVAGGGPSAGDRPPTPLELPGVEVDLRRLLHGGQTLTMHSAIPVAGQALVSTRVTDIWDKGKAAVVNLESSARGLDGTALWTGLMQIWARGEGGFGGSPGPASTWTPPVGVPDHVFETATSPHQALLYRLNGDMNPLHADPDLARAAGFDRPILHGLASYGILAKQLVDGLLDGEPLRLRSLTARFAGPLVPGQTLRTRVWLGAERHTLLVTCPDSRDAPVLTHASARVDR